jgi:hypothetical protein
VLAEDGEIVARARSIPVRWNGSVDDLPVGIDGAIARGFDEEGANVLCALVIMVPRVIQGRGVSAAAVKAMGGIARRRGLGSLIAPVRPSWKDRYPLVAIERYAQWRRPDGFLFDPWMRVHERLGAVVLKAEPRSLRIRQCRRVGAVDRDVVPGQRRVLVPQRPLDGIDRPRRRHRRLLGAERVDEAHALNGAGVRDRGSSPRARTGDRTTHGHRRSAPRHLHHRQCRTQPAT